MSTGANNSPNPASKMPGHHKSFFDHLHYDVRCVIYGYLDLPPISLSCLGFVMSCREALQETERFAVQQLNQHLKDLEDMAQREDSRLLVPAIRLSAIYVEMNCVHVALRDPKGSVKVPETIHGLLQCSFSKVSFKFLREEDLDRYEAVLKTHQTASNTNDMPEFLEARSTIAPDSGAAWSVWVLSRLLATNHECVGPVKPVRTTTIEMTWGSMPARLPKGSEDVKLELIELPSDCHPLKALNGAQQELYQGPRLEEFRYKNGRSVQLSLSSACRCSHGGLAQDALWKAYCERKRQQLRKAGR